MRLVRRLLYALSPFFLLAFPFGPLFPWSPVQPGYQTLHLTRADIVHPAGTQLDPAYREADRFIADAEAFHGLSMPRRVTLIAVRDWSDFERFMPQYRAHAVGAVTLATGTAIYVTPKLGEKGLDTAEFLRHELSHAALHQNQSLLHAYTIGREQWFCEGLAVLFGRQRAYVDAAAFTRRARQMDLTPLFDGTPQNDMRLAYQAWRYHLDYRIRTGGRPLFLELERGCIGHPGNCRGVFQRVYGRSVETSVVEFQRAIRSGFFKPED